MVFCGGGGFCVYTVDVDRRYWVLASPVPVFSRSQTSLESDLDLQPSVVIKSVLDSDTAV